MKHAAIEQVIARVESAKSDSDFTYFFSLLLAVEALAKIIVLGIVAAITDDKDRKPVSVRTPTGLDRTALGIGEECLRMR